MTNTIEQQCREMGALLGLKGSVSEQVLQAAVMDSAYAHNLLVCRNEPEYLAYLLQHPPIQNTVSDVAPVSTTGLLSRAADSLVRWAKTGFSRVSDEAYKQRLAACNACPHFIVPPKKNRMLYKVAGADENERSVCGQCGCIVKDKAFRISDTCPDEDPLKPGYNRWNEPLQSISHS